MLPSIGILRGHTQRHNSLHQSAQRHFLTDFGDFIASEWVMLCIYYTLLVFYNWKQQANVHISIMWMYSSFKFTREISINKFEVPNFQVRLWNLIKRLATPLCINISIWSYKFCYGLPKFCKALKQRVVMTPKYQEQSRHSSSHPRFALQRNPPSWCWNILIGRNVNFVVPNRPNLTF
jgi:hypothetical protein